MPGRGEKQNAKHFLGMLFDEMSVSFASGRYRMRRRAGDTLIKEEGKMEHVTEGLQMAAAAGLFVLAVSLMLLTGRGVDDMFAAQQEISLPGTLLREAENE